jgi:hypothetical protein
MAMAGAYGRPVPARRAAAGTRSAGWLAPLAAGKRTGVSATETLVLAAMLLLMVACTAWMYREP